MFKQFTPDPSASSRVSLLKWYGDDDAKKRKAIENYIHSRLVTFDTTEKYDINDPKHSIVDIFSKIKDSTLRQMFEASGIPYTNENIAAILDAANLRRVKEIITKIEGSPWFEQKRRVLEQHPFVKGFHKAVDYFNRDVEDQRFEEEMARIEEEQLKKYTSYLESIEGESGNTFASRVHTLPTGVCSKFPCSILGGGFGRVKKTKKKVRRSKRKYKNVHRKNKSHRKKAY